MESFQTDVAIVDDFDPIEPRYRQAVDDIVALSRGESMVAISHQSIRSHHVPVAAFMGGELAGYGAVTHIYSPYVVEVGGLLVPERFRREGIATQVLRRVVGLAQAHLTPDMIISFGNSESSELFCKVGAKVLEHPAAQLPPEVWKVCETCRFYEAEVLEKGRLCCGRVFDVTGINES